MRVFVLGGTGSIGSAVVQELVQRGHEIWGLARSEVSAARLRELGAMPVAGDAAAPEVWAAKLLQVDAVIHASCDFNTGMDAIDRHLLDVLLPALAAQPKRPRFIYTGGCWLFGAAGDDVATEETPFHPLPDFAWMVPHLRRILETAEIDGIVIHPAMVYTPGGGVFLRFAREAIEREAIRVVESEAVRWPLVHSRDLANLYALALEKAPARSSYIGAAIDGLAVGRIARAFAMRRGTRRQQPQIIPAEMIAAELGAWAKGYALDQRLSGAKARRELGWKRASRARTRNRAASVTGVENEKPADTQRAFVKLCQF
ncbi:NAD-dependent epimerase/dehydratase family protein [Bradyrhizobium sp.]|uniref:NAD-dependent epimerase/dehydratase family protein n=1 Tax=Bradyrhizobium sp. TaxID=376 RepID=UPI0025C5296B|nr:NAD-dependent epimerase/dehydratase family protein [Bradyrhizobium sp.]